MTAKGKILILKLNEQLLSILIRDNQILSIQVQNQNEYAVGNIYVGKVKNISENIGAAFVDLGQGYLTFLPLTDAKYACVVNRKADGKIKAGDEIPVQIIKEPMKTKLAGVTTAISLSGQYAVVGVPRQEHSEDRIPTEPDTGTQTEDSDGICGRNIVQITSKLSKKKQVRFRNI